MRLKVKSGHKPGLNDVNALGLVLDLRNSLIRFFENPVILHLLLFLGIKRLVLFICGLDRLSGLKRHLSDGIDGLHGVAHGGVGASAQGEGYAKPYCRSQISGGFASHRFSFQRR